MVIGIDIRCLANGKKSGVEEYTNNLLKHLFSLDKKNKYILFLNSFKNPKLDLNVFLKNKNVYLKRLYWPNKLLNFLFWYLSWPKIDKMIGQVDIMFFPNIIFSAVSSRVKVIQTFHDLSFETYPETFFLKSRLWHLAVNPRRLAKSADIVVCVSESTAQDLRLIYNVPKGKIRLIHSGAKENIRFINRNDPKLIEIKRKYCLPYEFIFYLGAIEPRKNIITLLRAFEALKENSHPAIKKCALVIAGSSGWKQKIVMEEIEKSKFRSEIQFLGFVNDEDLPYVYNLAKVFVYLSLYEGFGFPPLEAMNCGKPVIASNRSSLSEVIDDGGILVDPERPDEVEKALYSLLTDKELHKKMSLKAINRSKNFNWRITAKKFQEVIQELSKNV